MNAKARVYTQAVWNIGAGISDLTIADGAAEQLTGILDRTKELSTQPANGVHSNRQRKALDNELSVLEAEYGRIVQSTTFNGVNVFGSDTTTLSLQVGYGNDALLNVSLLMPVTTGDGTFQARRSFGTGFVLLQQAAVSVLAQANLQPQLALRLLSP